MSRRPSVVVIGGGVIGLAIAWRLARRDVAVTVLDREEPTGGASTAAAGMLSPLAEADEPGPFLDLALRSLSLYPGFVSALEAEAGMSVHLRRDGRLDVALDAAAAAELRRRAALQETAGHPGRLLEPAELRRVEPEVNPAAALGLLTGLDHQVDNARLATALGRAAERAGVGIRRGASVAAVEAGGGGRSVAAVRLASGEAVPAGAVVVAAGAWSGTLALPRNLPVRPVRGEIVVVRRLPPLVSRVVWGPECYLVPRGDGRLLIGATMVDAGFEADAMAGGIARMLEAGIGLVPAVAGAVFAGVQVGLRPATPDALPILGRDPDLEGLFYATGHFRNGILLAPVTAELLCADILDGTEIDAAFSAGRFSTRPPG